MRAFYYLLFTVPFLILIFVFNFPAPPWPDAVVYDSVARDFMNSGIFRYSIFGDFDASYLRANFNNGPLYPLVHMVFLKIFGSTDSRLLLIFNYILAVLTFINISRVLRLSTEQLLLMVVLVFNPVIYHYTNILRPEWMNIFLFSCIWRIIPYSYIGASFLLALAALNHQFSIFFVPFVLYLVYRKEGTWMGRIRGWFLVCTFTALFLTPYLIYIFRHWGDFVFQLFGNQIAESASGGFLKFARSFVVPLFYPSISIYTITDRMPRWQADFLPFGLIAGIAALIFKWRRGIKFSDSTKEAFFFWFFLNLGCAVTTFNPYVALSFSVFAVALLRDIFPVITPRFKMAVGLVAVVGIIYQLVFYNKVADRLFRWEDYKIASACISNQLPDGADVYVMAYPDPSVELNNLRNDIGIKRYIDFAKYADAWKQIVANRKYFIVSNDAIYLNRFDYENALRNGIEAGLFSETRCEAGNIGYTVLKRR